MDIDLLSKMVKELILDNDRVVLPGLGSFVAEIVPSTFSDKGYTINPPYRRLYFRSRPDEGNELVEFYAAGNNLELSVAERIIKDYVAELKSVLHVKKAVVFPGLGRLRATKENNLFFVADEDLDIYPAGFGLEPVSLKTHQETKEEVTAAVEELKSMLPEIPVRRTEPEPEAVQTMPEMEAVPDKELEEDVPAVPSIEESVPEIEAEVSVTEEPVPEIEAVTEIAEAAGIKKADAGKVLRIVSLVILIIVLLMLAALFVLGRVAPEWVDSLLYTPEELKILNHMLK